MLFLAAQYLFADVDTTMLRVIDVTYDGKPDTIFCHIFSKSWQDPMSYIFSVHSLGKLILSDTTNESSFMDSMFYLDSGRISQQAYFMNKKAWYLDSLLAKSVHIVPLSDTIIRPLIKDMVKPSIQIRTQFYPFFKDTLKLKQTRIDKEFAEIIAFYSKRPIILFLFPYNTEVSSVMMTFYPKYKRVFKIWDEN